MAAGELQFHGLGVALILDTYEPVTIEVAEGHLEQIVDNLLDNATEASPSPGEIHIKAVNHGSHTEIHITDRGRGLDEQGQQRAFDRFWRAPDATPGSGSRLGLAIARQLARLSGGVDAVITLRTAPGPGPER